MEPQKSDSDLLSLQKKFYKNLQQLGRTSNTLKNYRVDLGCFNQYMIKEQKNLDIDKFNPMKIKQYGDFLQEKYTSNNSRRRRVQTLRLFFDFLVKKGLFSENPVKMIPSSPKFLDIPRPTSLKDIETLWAHLIEESHSGHPMEHLLAKRNQVIVLLIFGAAPRVSDIVNLKNKHIITGKSPRVIITPRQRDHYSVGLPALFTSLYKDYRQNLEEAKKSMKLQFDHVLFNANPHRIFSGGISARGLEIIFKEYKKHLRLDILTPKSLRQACIFKWLWMKKSDTLIKEWMGVAPSYSMKLYRSHMKDHVYKDDFLIKAYQNEPKQ